METRTKGILAVIIVGGVLTWGLFFGGFKFAGDVLFPGQPITGITGTTVCWPDDATVTSAAVKIYGDSGLTDLKGSITSDGTTGAFTVSGSFQSGQIIWVQGSAADYYISIPKQVKLGLPDANSEFSVGNIYLAKQYASTDITMTATHDNGTALAASAAITASTFTGFELKATGIPSGEQMGYENVLYGLERKQIIQQVVIRIVVTGGNLYFSRAPDYEKTVGTTIEYIFIVDGEPNSAYDDTDGIWALQVSFSSVPAAAISDIDVYLYCDGNDLDNTITLQDISQANFAGYTAAEDLSDWAPE